MNQNKKILFVFMLILGMIGGQLYSPESNAMPKKVKKQYTKVLQKYVNKGADQFMTPTFALVDIDRNGIPELMIQKEGIITGKMLYYTCKKSNQKLVKLKGPSTKDNYPCFGGLSQLPSRKSYAFSRSGPACNDEKGNGVMPHCIMEYKIKKNRIVCINSVWKKEYLNQNKAEYSGTYCGKKKVTKANYDRISNAFRNEIEFKNISRKNIAKLR